MIRLKINGRDVEVPETTTVLEASREAGIAIPTLCYCRETTPNTSCMVCVVKNAATGKTLLSCASAVEEGMDIVTDDDEVHALRRDTLALLLAEHAGDCEGPCERACPAGLRVPRLLRRLQRGDGPGASAIAREDLLFPAILGRVCPAPCQRICRREQYDTAIAIRACHGGAAETWPEAPLEPPASASGKTVAIVGAGLAGLAAARVLAQHGHACRIYEKEDRLCPGLDDSVPDTVRDAEFAFLRAWNVESHTATEVAIENTGALPAVFSLQACLDQNDAVVLAFKDAQQPEDDRVAVAHEEKMPVRAVAAGKRAALRIHALLTGGEYRDRRPFNSRIGRLEENDLAAYAVARKDPEPAAEIAAALAAAPLFPLQPAAGDGTTAAQAEAARCLHCDCLQPNTCKLRQYADEYEVTLGGKRNLPHRSIAAIERADEVFFEPGKCIKCGICSALTRKYGVEPGMTISGRGIKSRVRAALGASLKEGLGDAADACVKACPTAALAREREHDTDAAL